MPDLLRIQTADFELSIWCSDISKRQATYQETLAKRQATNNHSLGQPIIRFSPPLDIVEATFMDQLIEIKGSFTHSGLLETLELNDFIFFENTQYQFELVFIEDKKLDDSYFACSGKVEDAYLTHRSHIINENFRFVKSANKPLTLARLTGTINTANDVGWLRLPFNYIKSSQTYKINIAFEVLPTKMSLQDDLPSMYQAIDTVFPLWRFSLVEKTEQDSAQSKQRHQFPLLWLANFNHLRNQLTHALKVINQAPHSRLQTHISYNKAARLKGKLPVRLGAKIKEDFANGLHDQRYQVIKKQLSVDTPENRFIKMVVVTSKKRLADFEYKLRQSNTAPDKQRLSDAFLDELHQWQQPLQKTLKQGFMTDVGDYNGRNRESLVLQQKVGYSSVYRIWQELKFYLDVFDNQSSISMKSVAEIYEVWCFLTLRNILMDELEFKEVATNKQALKLKNFFEYQLQDGFAGAFKFKRDDGVVARLVHEPPFHKTTKNIRTYSVSQKPDILLEVTLPNNKQFIWLFDAKYRIKTKKNQYEDFEQNIDAIDYVPDDAVNQMHRYRDALIRINQYGNTDANTRYKSRPVCGAFALYPGYFDQENQDNPYINMIDEISIGAFALLPNFNQDNTKAKNSYIWLLNFLRQNIGNNISSNELPIAIHQYKPCIEERIYLQDAARIPYDGMQQVLYRDLTLILTVDKMDSYYNGMKDGTATSYTIDKNSCLSRYDYHILNEVHYLGLALCSDTDSNNYQLQYIWPVKKMITLTHHFDFKLNKRLKLQSIVHGIPDYLKESFKLTTLDCLQGIDNFNDIKEVYSTFRNALDKQGSF